MKLETGQSPKLFDTHVNARDLALLLGYVAIVVMAAFHVARVSINHDVAGFLLEVRGLGEGRVYNDMNMPSNLWLAKVSVFISEHVSYYLADIHQALLFVFGAICTTLVLCLMRSAGVADLVKFAVVLGSASILLITPGYIFGQREHLFALSFAPLFALQYQKYVSARVPLKLSILTVVVAAFGASLKPFFMVFLLAVGGMDFALKGFRRIAWEFVFLYFLIAVYLVWITVAYPTYFSHVLPGAVASYGSMRLPLDRTLLMGLMAPFASIELFFLNIAMYGLGLSMTRRDALDIRPFLAFLFIGISAWLMAVAQRFGFDYHFLPFKLFVGCASVIVFAWLIVKVIDRLDGFRFAPSRKGAETLGYVLVSAYLLFLPGRLDPDANAQLTRRSVLDDQFTKTLQALPPRTPILMISTRPANITVIQAYSDIRWSGAFISLFSVLPAMSALAPSGDADAGAFKEEPFRSVKDSFANPAPEFVFVDVSKVMTHFSGYAHPDMVDFLSKDPDFRKIWSGYRKVGHVDTIFGQEADVFQRYSAPVSTPPGTLGAKSC